MCTKEEPITGKPMNFNANTEDEAIREAALQKLDRPVFITSNKVWRE